MKRRSLADAACPIARSLDAVGDAWSVLVVRDAFAGRRRFGEFVESLGVAKNILADRLKRLVERGVLAQVPAADGGAYSEYALTDRGRGLAVVLAALGRWGDAGPGYGLVDARTGEQVRLELRTPGGRKVRVADVRLAAGAERAGG